MPNTDNPPFDEVAAVRDRFLAEFPTIKAFAEAMGVSVRTVERMVSRKEVDLARFGRMRRVNVSATREKTISRPKQTAAA
jgi:excisionase family DNA binding protein